MSYLIIDKLYPIEDLDKIRDNYKPSQIDRNLMNKLYKILRKNKLPVTRAELKEVIFFSVAGITREDLMNIINNPNMCVGCGNCCKSAKIIELRGGEVKNITEKYGNCTIKLENSYYFRNTNPCMFLNGENRCDIYEDRPQTCKDYPIFYKDDEILLNKTDKCWYIYRFLEIKVEALINIIKGEV